ncbi:hypothetical protein FNV43_RR07166 [Rhamnella rubrinervis]|uniref:Glycosyltransferase n=1 Tax=Rhamnella rubrinervis TaxID=2594499 RepID=A0A8K0HEE9_9ROSA|nr:hypothetical protein FNV43_RR07166 [Rhamnella rubrinervis]
MEDKGYRGHVLTLPYPTQGHLNPLLQFSKHLAHSKGLKITFATTVFISNTFKPKLPHSVQLDTISDGYDQGGFAEAESVAAYLTKLEAGGSQTLANLILRHKDSPDPIDCIVYDSFLPWALNVAKQFGIASATFFTQPCTVNYIYYCVHHGLLKLPAPSFPVSIPGLQFLEFGDMPSFISVPGSHPAYFEMVLNQFSNSNQADFILINAVYGLEEEVVNWMSSQWPIKNIGPSIPSIYLDKRLEDDVDYGLNLFKPQVETCKKWLDSKDMGSVIYVSFGSLAALREDQMKELAWGLKKSNSCFLWVVREAEMQKLPINFQEETAEQGLVVTWCSQLQVLSHPAVGCFVTHCGWNSTLEALSLGVPMVAVPQWTDQTTNAKFVKDVWEVGTRVKVDAKGFFTREEIELCIRQVMQGERELEIKRNSAKWKKLAKEAVDEGGSSDKNIEEFVAQLSIDVPK